jgi:hypothetical protein
LSESLRDALVRLALGLRPGGAGAGVGQLRREAVRLGGGGRGGGCRRQEDDAEHQVETACIEEVGCRIRNIDALFRDGFPATVRG